MISPIYIIILSVATLITYSVAFMFGYYATTQRIKSLEGVKRGSGEHPLKSNKVTYNWHLTPEEIDKIDDWEEFEEKAEE